MTVGIRSDCMKLTALVNIILKIQEWKLRLQMFLIIFFYPQRCFKFIFTNLCRSHFKFCCRTMYRMTNLKTFHFFEMVFFRGINSMLDIDFSHTTATTHWDHPMMNDLMDSLGKQCHQILFSSAFCIIWGGVNYSH